MDHKIYAQVVIIGSGPSGYSAAFRCADLGLDTILIENYKNLGGVCLNVGCIPSKTLLHIAKVIKESQELSKTGVLFGKPVIDINKIRDWKNKVINQLNSGLSYLGNKRNIKIIQGKAVFDTKNSILVKNEQQVFTIFFKHAIIATGSNPIKIPSISYDHENIWNSTDALLLKKIPSRFLIVGAGIIGLEMATIYSSLGSQVDVIDRFQHFLPSVDSDISNIYLSSVRKTFNILLNTSIGDINTERSRLLVTLIENHVKQTSIYYDAILIAIGRSPNINNLGLEKIGIKINDLGFIDVNKQLKTNIDNIYAVGDVTGAPMLAHKGMHEGRVAAEVISGKNHYFEPKVIPNVAYTNPEISWVGLNEKETIKNNINYEISCFPWNSLGRSIASNENTGMTKLIFNKNTNQIIGGSIIGVNSGELIGEIALAIEMGCDAEDISLTIHAHPTLSESIGLSADIFQGTITDILNEKARK